MKRLVGWRAGVLMIPDGISSCRVAVPSPRDLLAPLPSFQAGPAAGASAGAESAHENPEAHGSPKAYGVLQSHPVVNRVCPRLLAPCVPPTYRVLGCTLTCGRHWCAPWPCLCLCIIKHLPLSHSLPVSCPLP